MTAADPRGTLGVVLVHGNASSAQVWRRVRERLARRPELVVEAPDLPGFGGAASAPRGRALAEVVTEWATRRPCLVVGAGAGGLLALAAAASAPATVLGVVVAGPAGLPGGHGLPPALAGTSAGAAVVRAAGASVLRGRFLADQLAEPDAAPADVRNLLLDGLRQARDFDRLTRECVGLVEAGFRAVTCPVNVLWGARSGVQPIDGVDDLRERLPAGVRIDVVPDGGHALALEQPDRVAETVVTLAARALRRDRAEPA